MDRQPPPQVTPGQALGFLVTTIGLGLATTGLTALFGWAVAALVVGAALIAYGVLLTWSWSTR